MGTKTIRWPLADDADQAQQALFGVEAVVERRVGTGEYHGLEFLHVNARRIINEVPQPARLPFRFTINAYRGCTHACTYCFARPSHEFLGLDRGRDFDTRIVVKVNAADRLRVELAHPRWAGDSIAMGTNTDPYQRAEARYHLTRRITEVLVERANPFSVLTKSTLILRDLDLLARAAAAGLVRVNLSIGTLDEQVWRATEPGTPHPARRLEAVARLNQAGVPCGVLVAPVLPGLSDHPQQLRAVVEGAVAAGAVSVTPIALHLRPGVREHFLSWLAGYRPDLVGTYTQRYSRAYLPAADQKGLAAAVAGWQRGCPAPEATDGPTRQERPGRASSSQHAE